MNDFLMNIQSYGIVPVVNIENADDALPLCGALKNGGLPIVEITFRTDAAQESIAKIAAEMPEILLGVGTVLTVEQARRAVESGAKYIVTPGCNPKIMEYCVNNEISITPGCCNSTDIETALSFGLDAVKFYPAEQYGGIETIKALSGSYRNVKFVPTGGINENNLNDYLSFTNVLACGSSFMAKDEWIKAKAFDKIEHATKEAVSNMLGFNIGHIGINCEDEQSAQSVAKAFSSMFGFQIKDGNTSVFAGSDIEVCKSKARGTCGHIAVNTRNIERAKACLLRQGVAFDESSTKTKEGKVIAIYFKEPIGGFAIHLLQKQIV